RDLSRIDLWSGRVVTFVELPAGPLRVGEWHHLVVASTPSLLRVYVDGVRCVVVGGAPFTASANHLPLQVGASSPEGEEQCACAVDEVAIYGRVLSEEDVARHIAAIGWAERREKLLRERQRREGERRRRQEEALRRRMNDPQLLARGQSRVYQGEYLRAISLPLGGIGTGVIQINGRAERHAWQIFNNFEYAFVPHSFFAVWTRVAGREPLVRALQTSAVGPFPAMESLTFRGEYPFGWYDFADPDLPLAVQLETFNPLIPLNTRDSALPCAVFNLTAENPGDQPIEVSFLATQQNAVGFTGRGEIQGRSFEGYGGNVNRVLREEGATILHLTSNLSPDAPAYGDLALAALRGEATFTAAWEGLEALLKDWAPDGTLSGSDSAGPSPAGQTLDGALAVAFTLQPGEQRTVSFVLTWHFPNAQHGSRGWGGKGNRYANWWPDALSVARELKERLPELTRLTRLYHDTLYASNLPYWLLDRLSSQVAVLRSKTCFWTQEGYFGGWEGCRPDQGCCFGNCAHVWHYAQAQARLFPSIARLMREQAFRFQREEGAIPFRQPRFGIAADGQLGEVLEAYREHLLSPDRTWLDQHWPHIQKALEFAITTWDSDEDGVLAGAQHNTLDGELGGSTSWMGTLYLAALAAAERMAELEGDPAAARRYRRIREAGARKQNETLWNGEYYIQIPDPEPREDYGNGCHIDQVLGQWWAHQLGLGWLYPPERVRTALRSLLKYNFRDNFRGIPQRPRKFVDDEDAGMQMITWPQGDRPAPCMRYADEVMTGFEYAAAATMVQAGLLREGLMVVRAVYERYDGRLRTGLSGAENGSAAWGYSGNPFGDDECGKFYARAMSAWSLLLASQGFLYDGPAGRLGFKPLWKPEDHVSFFTAAEGWGLYTQKRNDRGQTHRLAVRYGRLRLRELVFEVPPNARPTQVNVQVEGRKRSATFAWEGRELWVTLAEPLVLETDAWLQVEVFLE
ncbi:MAG TPA: glucosylceramidase, partial [Armatimonadetes bacterium]|nr:glucosylceramidase [Armatimonadota bacterium]